MRTLAGKSLWSEAWGSKERLCLSFGLGALYALLIRHHKSGQMRFWWGGGGKVLTKFNIPKIPVQTGRTRRSHINELLCDWHQWVATRLTLWAMAIRTGLLHDHDRGLTKQHWTKCLWVLQIAIILQLFKKKKSVEVELILCNIILIVWN